MQRLQVQPDTSLHFGGNNPEFPVEIVEFCSERGILPHFREAALLAHQTFKSVRTLDARIQVDPEGDEERVVIDVTVDATVDEVLAAKKAYTRQWVQTAPPEVRDQIRLLYHLV